MPVYEFACSHCHQDFELLCPMGTEVESVSCPTCHKNHVTRKVSLFGFASGSNSREEYSGPACSAESGGGCGSCSPTGCGCH